MSFPKASTALNRFTVLDLTLQTGTLDECVEELFALGGFWAAEPAHRR